MLSSELCVSVLRKSVHLATNRCKMKLGNLVLDSVLCVFCVCTLTSALFALSAVFCSQVIGIDVLSGCKGMFISYIFFFSLWLYFVCILYVLCMLCIVLVP